MKTPDKILTLPAIERSLVLVRECMTLQCLGALGGIPGTGKTMALRAIESRYSSMGLPGTCLYYRCCTIFGASRGIKDLLEAIGVRPGLIPVSATLQFTIKIAERELNTRQIRLILLDEADSWDTQALQGLITLYDTCSANQHPITFIFSGSVHLVKWLSKHSAAISRTLRFEAFENLTLAMTIGVLSQWSDSFETLARQVSLKDPENTKISKLIFQSTGGNLRRLSYFAKLAALEEKKLSLETVKALLQKIHSEAS